MAGELRINLYPQHLFCFPTPPLNHNITRLSPLPELVLKMSHQEEFPPGKPPFLAPPPIVAATITSSRQALGGHATPEVLAKKGMVLGHLSFPSLLRSRFFTATSKGDAQAASGGGHDQTMAQAVQTRSASRRAATLKPAKITTTPARAPKKAKKTPETRDSAEDSTPGRTPGRATRSRGAQQAKAVDASTKAPRARTPANLEALKRATTGT
jgi:hypothetical protein